LGGLYIKSAVKGGFFFEAIFLGIWGFKKEKGFKGGKFNRLGFKREKLEIGLKVSKVKGGNPLLSAF